MIAATRQAHLTREQKEAFEADECMICLAPPVAPTALPCGHSFCTTCVTSLRAQGVAQVCPLCREELPPSKEMLYDLAVRLAEKSNKALANNAFVREDLDDCIVRGDLHPSIDTRQSRLCLNPRSPPPPSHTPLLS